MIVVAVTPEEVAQIASSGLFMVNEALLGDEVQARYTADQLAPALTRRALRLAGTGESSRSAWESVLALIPELGEPAALLRTYVARMDEALNRSPGDWWTAFTNRRMRWRHRGNI